MDAAGLQRRDRLRAQAAVLQAERLVGEVGVDLDDLLVLGLEDRGERGAAGLVGEDGLVGVGALAVPAGEAALAAAAFVLVEGRARGKEELGGLLLGRRGGVLGDLDLERGESFIIIIII